MSKKKITYKKQDASKLRKEIAKNNQSSREAVKEITDLLMTPTIKRKAMGGDLKTEYRGGGVVDLRNFKGQF
jgi:cell division protein FtsL